MTPKKPAKRSKPRSRSWLWRWRRVLFLAGLALFAAGSGLLYLMSLAPLPDERTLDETTILTDVGGARLASFDQGENRVPVRLAQVPDVVVDAVLATEDRNFFDHGGVDPAGIIRATVADLRGRSLQGGSTITQQYVKNVYLGPERTIWRKLREASLAIKVERKYSKPEILERYLNTVYFGRGAYGVQAASRAYFAKDVGQLGLSEAAYLAGLIRAPEAADAARDPEAAEARRYRTLERMRRAGMITRAEAEQAAKVPLPTVVQQSDEPTVVMTDKGTQYFVEYVRAELVRRFGTDLTYSGGLRVKTSLDLGLQAKAYDAVYGRLKPEEPAGALVAVDSEGRIRAMVGGRDFSQSKVNFAAGAAGGGSGRQAGSTFKPFVLAAIVNDGYSVQSAFPAPASVVLPKGNDGKDYVVKNYDESADYGEALNLVDATAHSVNTVYVQAQVAIGAKKVIDTAHALGVTSELEPNNSLVLGTEEVSPLEMAAAYSTFANRGEKVAPRAILEVRTADGRVLVADTPPPRERVLPPEQADVVTYCLRQVVLRGSGRRAAVGTPVAGKTGTTQNYGDAWFVGYTPRLTAAVWMGWPEGSARRMDGVSGGSIPAEIFKRFMAEATKDPQYRGDFAASVRFRGKPLPPPSDKQVVLPTTTTTTTTTTAPPAATADQSSTTTSAPPPPPG